MGNNSADKSAKASAQARNKDAGIFTDKSRFAVEKRHESGQLTARTERTDWGVTGVHIGTWTPQGTVDSITESAPGIARFGTPGHGGVKLSAARNRLVHPALRRVRGVYEEDTEAHIVNYFFPEETLPLVSRNYTVDEDLDAHIESARNGVRDWYPDEFEVVTGETIQPGQSYLRDQRTWTEAHKDQFVVTSALTDRDDRTQVLVRARRGTETKEYRVSLTEYDARNDGEEIGKHGRFVIDVARHEEIIKTPAAVPSVKHATEEDLKHLFGQN
jgi:hypothetical protein